MDKPQLSLLAQYDELVRNRTVLTAGIEMDFLKFVQSQESCRKRWLEAEQTFGEMKERLRSLERENEALQTKLKHARSQIDHELRKRQKTEQERDSYEKQIELVRELLTDKNRSTLLDEKDRQRLAFLSTDFNQASLYQTSPRKNLTTIEESGSLLSPSDISYDKTEEDIDVNESYLRSGKLWKGSGTLEAGTIRNNRKSQIKKGGYHRRSNSADVMISGAGTGPVVTEAELNRSRRFSSPAARTPQHIEDDLDTAFRVGGGSGFRGRPPRVSTASNSSPNTDVEGMRRYNSGNTLNRLHSYVTKTVIKSETCIACGKKLRFGKSHIKCKDCRAVAHPECKEAVPLPCIPLSLTPGGSNKNLDNGGIEDFAPRDAPYIPGIVVSEELERTLSFTSGFNERSSSSRTHNKKVSDITHVNMRNSQNSLSTHIVDPGAGFRSIEVNRPHQRSDKEVKELKEKFLKGRGPPNLSQLDIHVVSSCLKDFLRSLSEPLVTYKWRNKFIQAVDKRDRTDMQESSSDLIQAVSLLPPANRDTIAYIMLHLQKIAEGEKMNKMSIINLSKVFGPTIVGYSDPVLDAAKMLEETPKQARVIEGLLRMPSDYWDRFINVDQEIENLRDFGTPISADVPHSMLGPVSMSTEALNSVERAPWYSTKTPGGQGTLGSAMKTRPYGTASANKPPQFFSSPMLR